MIQYLPNTLTANPSECFVLNCVLNKNIEFLLISPATFGQDRIPSPVFTVVTEPSSSHSTCTSNFEAMIDEDDALEVSDLSPTNPPPPAFSYHCEHRPSNYIDISRHIPTIYHSPHDLRKFYSALSPYASPCKPWNHPLLELPQVLKDAFHEYEITRFLAALTTHATPACQLRLQDQLYSLSDYETCFDVLSSLFDKFPDAIIKLKRNPEYILIKRADVAAEAIEPCNVIDQLYAPSTHYRAIMCTFSFQSVLIPHTLQEHQQDHKFAEITVDGRCVLYLQNQLQPSAALLHKEVYNVNTVLHSTASLDDSASHPRTDLLLPQLNLYHDLVDGVDIHWTLTSVNDFHLSD